MDLSICFIYSYFSDEIFYLETNGVCFGFKESFVLRTLWTGFERHEVSLI